MKKNGIKQKIFPLTLCIVAVFSVIGLFSFAGIAYGEENGAKEYKLLEPIDGLKKVPSGGALEDYLGTIFKFAVGTAGVLAVLMLVIAGIEYMAPSSQAKSDAKDRITSAIGGLLLVLTSFLILKLINPQLLSNFSVGELKINDFETRKYDINTPRDLSTLELGQACVVNKSPYCKPGLTCSDGECKRDPNAVPKGNYVWGSEADCSFNKKTVAYDDQFCSAGDKPKNKDIVCCGPSSI